MRAESHNAVLFNTGHNEVSDMAVLANACKIIWRVVTVHKVANAVTARRKKKKNR
jgi:precorrin-6x reductase